MKQIEGGTTNEVESSECGRMDLKVYSFSRAAERKDISRERLYVSGENKGFLSPVKKRVVALESEDILCIVESLNNYSGYLHGAIERCPDLKSADGYAVRLSFVENLIARLTQ